MHPLLAKKVNTQQPPTQIWMCTQDKNNRAQSTTLQIVHERQTGEMVITGQRFCFKLKQTDSLHTQTFLHQNMRWTWFFKAHAEDYTSLVSRQKLKEECVNRKI